MATGFHDRAVNIVAMATEISEEERAVLWQAVSPADPSLAARQLGDALRSLGAARDLVNECYRVAFYTGDQWNRLSANPLFAYFSANKAGRPLDKWIHYFPIYERHLAPYRGQPVRLLEIGVYRGGGLDLLRYYLGLQATLIGIDIDDAARTAAGPSHTVEIGDQSDPQFLRAVSENHGPFDVVIDDGGHTMRQQVISAETLFPLLAEGGTYFVEDCHTSYWPDYADQGDGPTFMEWAKARLDDLNATHFSMEADLAEPWQTDLAGVHVYDSVVVMDKARRPRPFSELSGTKEFINYDRIVGALQLEVLATRDAAVASANALQADLDAAQSQLDAAQDARRSSDAELAQARSDLEGSWGMIRDMRRSHSWRITAPIRGVTERLRRS
jgi:hypothetical protein